MRSRERERQIKRVWKSRGKWRRERRLTESVERIFFSTTVLARLFVRSSHSAFLSVLARQSSSRAPLAWGFAIALYIILLDSKTVSLIDDTTYLGFPTPTLLARLGGTHSSRVDGLTSSRGTVAVLV